MVSLVVSVCYTLFASLAYDELFSSSQPKSKETVTMATNYIQVCTYICMHVYMYVLGLKQVESAGLSGSNGSHFVQVNWVRSAL